MLLQHSLSLVDANSCSAPPQGVFSLKKSYFEPRYVLLIPTQVEQYVGHLHGRGLYTQAQIDRAVSRIKLYADTNRQRPGFFDNVIASGTAERTPSSCSMLGC